MESLSWTSILEAFKQLHSSLHTKNTKRIEGFEQIYNLIPLLEQSQLLNSTIRTLSHYSLVFTLPNKEYIVIITPPGIIFTGSKDEFSVELCNKRTNEKFLSKKILVTNLDEVVKIAEDYFAQVQ